MSCYRWNKCKHRIVTDAVLGATRESWKSITEIRNKLDIVLGINLTYPTVSRMLDEMHKSGYLARKEARPIKYRNAEMLLSNRKGGI